MPCEGAVPRPRRTSSPSGACAARETRPNVVDLTRRLVDIPSTTGEEAHVVAFLARTLRSLGYTVELQEVAPGRENLFATAGSPARVVFSTHLDTVAPFIPSSEDSSFVYGRGSCDAKGIAAAQIAAAERLRARGVSGVGLLFIVDEEAGSMGAKAANSLAAAADCEYLIDGEPTDNVLGAGSKGSLRVRLSAGGRAAHSAYPRLGTSAIERLLDALGRVRAHAWPRDGFFGDCTVNIGTIAGGTASNVVPDRAQAELHFRLVTHSDRVLRELEAVAGDDVRVEPLSRTEPIAFETVEGFPRSVVAFTTDAPHLSRWGQALLYGPGSILDAHTARERVDKRALARSVDGYARLAEALLARSARRPIAV